MAFCSDNAALLDLLRRELPALVRQAVRAELAAQREPLTAPQRRLLGALAGEFADGPFTSAEVLRAATSPLKHHDALRQALAGMGLQTAQEVGQALRSLHGITRCKSERGSAV